jgi:hypothetical protein
MGYVDFRKAKMKTALEIYKAIDTEFCKGSPNSLVNRKCKTGKDVIVYAMEKYAKQYHQDKLKLLGIADVVDSKPELKAALNHAVSAIYFNDNSDYLSGLYGTVRSLTGLEEPTDEDITNLFKKLNP